MQKQLKYVWKINKLQKFSTKILLGFNSCGFIGLFLILVLLDDSEAIFFSNRISKVCSDSNNGPYYDYM